MMKTCLIRPAWRGRRLRWIGGADGAVGAVGVRGRGRGGRCRRRPAARRGSGSSSSSRPPGRQRGRTRGTAGPGSRGLLGAGAGGGPARGEPLAEQRRERTVPARGKGGGDDRRGRQQRGGDQHAELALPGKVAAAAIALSRIPAARRARRLMAPPDPRTRDVPHCAQKRTPCAYGAPQLRQIPAAPERSSSQDPLDRKQLGVDPLQLRGLAGQHVHPHVVADRHLIEGATEVGLHHRELLHQTVALGAKLPLLGRVDSVGVGRPARLHGAAGAAGWLGPAGAGALGPRRRMRSIASLNPRPRSAVTARSRGRPRWG